MTDTASNPPNLLLVDGHNVAYRSFFAIRELSTRDGRPTNALFGFVKTLQRLRDAHRPSHAMVAFDGGLPEARTEQWADYKAQRAPMPEALRDQLPLIQEYLTCARVAWRRKEGREADDLIAAAALRAEAEGARVRIASTDKDLFQLVSPRVAVVGLKVETPPLDPEGVRTKTGVPPERVLEWLALTGDSADNIPGVPGIGPKTAAALLGRFGTLAALWKRLDEVDSARVRAVLSEHRADVERNLELMRLRPEDAAEDDWRDWRVGEPDRDALIAFCERVEFHSLARALREPELF